MTEVGKAQERQWKRNDIQFPRLLAELNAVMEPTPLGDGGTGGAPVRMTFTVDELCESMDLRWAHIEELFKRADEVWEGIKLQPKIVDIDYAKLEQRWMALNSSFLGEIRAQAFSQAKTILENDTILNAIKELDELIEDEKAVAHVAAKRPRWSSAEPEVQWLNHMIRCGEKMALYGGSPEKVNEQLLMDDSQTPERKAWWEAQTNEMIKMVSPNVPFHHTRFVIEIYDRELNQALDLMQDHLRSKAEVADPLVVATAMYHALSADSAISLRLLDRQRTPAWINHVDEVKLWAQDNGIEWPPKESDSGS